MSSKIILSIRPILAVLCYLLAIQCIEAQNDLLKAGFLNPPDSATPGVYWYFMDGNTSREGITADLESMKAVGIGHVLFQEINVGVPRGKVDFMSDQWQDLFVHAVHESERLGIRLAMGAGPGWNGSGGPWVKPEQSMMHLVASSTEVKGPSVFHSILPKPEPREPFIPFGEESLTEKLKQIRNGWYEDVAVLAYPTPKSKQTIADIDGKALYYRAPYYGNQPGINQYFPAPASYPEVPELAINQSKIIDLTKFLQPDGSLQWKVPVGTWTILRFGKRNNGSVTRPAPEPGLGFECDKFDTVALDIHYNAYLGKLLKKLGPMQSNSEGGWKMIHMDSWEAGAQNWTGDFREQFKKRRGYDPLLFLPSYTGQIVGSLELSERFLWDMRLTSQELIIENHAGHLKALGRRSGFRLSIEPYALNPTADLDLGSVADIPMCEFWTDKFGFNAAFCCIEVASIAHIQGKQIVAAEAFTAEGNEAWKKYPGNMKDQTDWAFSMGINRFMMHTFAHQPLDDGLKPGMTMGPYGVHWDRNQTWWSMVPAYHKYLSRCSFILSQGTPVAEILYLTPEGTPNVFQAPESALQGTEVLPDKRGYAFDGCSALLLENAEVRNHRIVFPGGASYRVLVLPEVQTMTPELLSKIASLVKAGATVIGNPPLKSPSRVNYPACDEQVRTMANKLWAQNLIFPSRTPVSKRPSVSGTLVTELYPLYDSTASLLKKLGVNPDFTASGSIRYTHRSKTDREIYFISNRTDKPVEDVCLFRDGTLNAELWDPVTGEIRSLNSFKKTESGISIRIKLDPSQSFFVIFNKANSPKSIEFKNPNNFPEKHSLMTLDGPWTVTFDTVWGGPKEVVFDTLTDWAKRQEDGIRHYSGIGKYSKTFDMPKYSNSLNTSRIYLNLGIVKNMARVRLNGRDLGVVWTSPWQVKISGVVKEKGNIVEIEVANLWANRLIGDESFPDDGVKANKWPDWLLNGTLRPSNRYTFTTYHFYKKDDPLMESGLIGPVKIIED